MATDIKPVKVRQGKKKTVVIICGSTAYGSGGVYGCQDISGYSESYYCNIRY